MYTPPGFPASARVELARLKAIQELEDARTAPLPASWTESEWDRCAFYAYIMQVFHAFAVEVCELGKQGRWTVKRVRTEADEFLRRLTSEEYYERGQDRYGCKFRRMIGDFSDLLPEVKQAFQKFEEWRSFETDLLAVAERQAASDSQLSAQHSSANPDDCGAVEALTAATNTPTPTKPLEWEDIELSFIGDHDAEIRIAGTQARRVNYKQIGGFEDRRTGKPTQQWAMLRVFGTLPNGTMPDDARAGEEWEAIRKKIERTSKALRNHFGMTGDPFPYIRGTGYHARIKIRIEPDLSR